MRPTIHVREGSASDASELCALLNAIIARGGTTAHQHPFSADAFCDAYLRKNPSHRLCSVAEAGTGGALLGFQHLGHHPDLPPDWADIGTFARPEPKVRGVGRALFARTRREAGALGLVAINATIRADNAEGLGYYAAMGFARYKVDEAVPLADATPVDRISMRFDLAGRPLTRRAP